MPVLHVRALPQKNPVRIPQALKKACAAVAQAYGCPEAEVLGTWDEVRTGFYVQGQSAAPQQPVASHPPLAELVCYEGKPQEVIEKTLLAAAAALGEGLGLGKNVFVIYRKVEGGLVFAGEGGLRKAG